jgi:hypothetical protein
MKAEDRAPYTLAFALAFGGMMVGYYVPLIGVILTVCLLLLLIAALLGDAGGVIADLLARPFAALGVWLAQKDGFRWVRLAPFIGLGTGPVFRWIANGLATQGGA